MSDTKSNTGTLAYTSDDQPGMSRVRRGKGFSYHTAEGALVRDRKTLDRIRALAIPPAYSDVWICLKANGHIQAIGRDAKGRKQYCYHPAYRAAQDGEKFARLVRFGERLPKIRAQIAKDMQARSTRLGCVVATIIYLLDSTAIRIGNVSYAQQNGSFGLTTLRHRHVDLDASTIRFRFKGKSGRKWDLSVHNRRVARVLRGLQELPGQELFCYLDKGEVKPVSSDDINRYLREIGGDGFSAKDFRTWHGTVLAAVALAQLRQDDPAQKPQAAIRQAMIEVAAALQNTPTVCRQSYVHPALLEAFAHDHPMFTAMTLPYQTASAPSHFAPAERDVLEFLTSADAAPKRPRKTAARTRRSAGKA